MSNLVAHAEHELALLSASDPADEMQRAMTAHLLAMVVLFAAEGHSGFSASYAIRALEKLLRFEPLTPLTGTDDEWCPLDHGPEMVAQNKRCSRVFKRADGTAYDCEGRVFVDDDGCGILRQGSAVDVIFPYTPVTERVPYPREGQPT